MTVPVAQFAGWLVDCNGQIGSAYRAGLAGHSEAREGVLARAMATTSNEAVAAEGNETLSIWLLRPTRYPMKSNDRNPATASARERMPSTDREKDPVHSAQTPK